SVVGCVVVVFFFQAEDGIRDWSVTGIQTCALPIFLRSWWLVNGRSTLTPRTIMGVTTMKMMSSTRVTSTSGVTLISARTCPLGEIGRASCRERGGGRRGEGEL